MSADFTLTTDCRLRTLIPGDLCVLDLAFTPTAVGTRQARLTIPSDDPDSPEVVIQLQGDARPTVPGAPRDVSVVAGQKSATFLFNAPAFDGGSPITGYSVACSPNAVSAQGSASPIAVTGLSNGTTYSCAVSAANAAGTGAPSATVTVKPPNG